MVAVDTNVLVRLLANDHPAQSARAAAIFRRDPVFVPKSVLLETEWVLRYSYGLTGAAIMGAFRRVLGLPNVAVEDSVPVAGAIAWAESGIDFADALHLASSAAAVRFVTFDATLAKRAKKLGGVAVVAI